MRKAEDIYGLREIIKSKGKNIKIIAKIEKPEAIKNIDEIIKATDGLMVARGDLGVEIPMEEVPLAQKDAGAKVQRVGQAGDHCYPDDGKHD